MTLQVPQPSTEKFLWFPPQHVQAMFDHNVLALDPARETDRITALIRSQVLEHLRRRGVVVGLSGGIDSSVVAALCVRALGAERVLGLFMPERDSSGEALRLGRIVADHLGITALVEDLTPALEGIGCYRRQYDTIRSVVPEFTEAWKFKLVLPGLLSSERLNVTRLMVQPPEGETQTVRLPAAAYLQLVAATNSKQRLRKVMEYHHADRLQYAVAGTPNRLEYDQGFFVKQGDGAADLKPIAHLYKTQVYQLAEFLGIPDEIRERPPTTDTFSLPQTQEEFFFALPWNLMDLCLYAVDHGVPAEDAAPVLGLQPEQVERVYRDIEAKRRAARYLHATPLLASSTDAQD